MQFLGHICGGFVVGAVLLVAPVQSSPVQICNVPEDLAHQEVLFYETDQPLHLSFGKRMPRLAEFCLEGHRFHKGLVVFLPDWTALEVPVGDHTFHIVRQDILWDPHVAKGVDHANQQILLLGIGEELNIPLTAVVADHSKASCGVFRTVIVKHLGDPQSIW